MKIVKVVPTEDVGVIETVQVDGRAVVERVREIESLTGTKCRECASRSWYVEFYDRFIGNGRQPQGFAAHVRLIVGVRASGLFDLTGDGNGN